MNPIQITTTLFKDKISNQEIAYFRGAMIRLANGTPLFHNHNEKGFNYIYPLVQYKRIKGQAALMGINQGADMVEKLFEENKTGSCYLGNREFNLQIQMIQKERITISNTQVPQTYWIKHWLPLNSKNYREYLRSEGLIERVNMLEKILIGNILSFATGIGFHLDFPILCRILKLESPKLSPYKQVELMSFSALFQCNVVLPEHIGLGKSASLNNGIILNYNK